MTKTLLDQYVEDEIGMFDTYLQHQQTSAFKQEVSDQQAREALLP